MRFFRPRRKVRIAAAILAGVAFLGGATKMLHAQVDTRPLLAPIESAQALEVFFQLGLPDTANAQWVTVTGDLPMRADHSRTNPAKGNAWLLSEKPDGSVELLLEQSVVFKAKKTANASAFQPGTPREPGALPLVEIKPADLDRDTRALLELWNEAKALITGPSTGNDSPDIYEAASLKEMRKRQFGDPAQAVLFLAHLQKRGQTQSVQAGLPSVVAMGGSSKSLLDETVSQLAETRLTAFCEAWLDTNDSAQFAAEVEKLAKEFSRGWGNQASALLLVERLRHPKPGAHAEEPGVKAAADFLLGLTPAQVANLPTRRNWLHPGAGTGGPGDGLEALEIDEDGMVRSSTPKRPMSATEKAALESFFSKPRDVVPALVGLLDDDRLLRATLGTLSPKMPFFSGFQNDDEEETVEAGYGQLPRPMAVCEAAAALLEAVMPGDEKEMRMSRMLSRRSDTVETQRLIEWAGKLSKLDDEGLAWEYLAESGSSSNEQFGMWLDYLIEHGQPATIQKLQAVFYDPAVWNGDFESVLTRAAAFLNKFRGDRGEFGAKVRAAVETFRERRAGSIAEDDFPELRKQMRDQLTAQQRKLDQLFKEVSLVGALDELLTADEDDRAALLDSLPALIQRTPPEEAEILIFRTAAKLKASKDKFSVLALRLPDERSAMGSAPSSSVTLGPLHVSPADREILLAMLGDSQTKEKHARSRTEESLADLTTRILLGPRLSADERARWTAMGANASHFSSGWLRARAVALVKGEVLPPIPDASRVNSEETVVLLAELAALPPERITPALLTKSPDAVVALLAHLNKPETVWPESLAKAHLRITNVQGNFAAAFGAMEWKDRKLDEALISEITSAIEKSVLDRHLVRISVESVGSLVGLTLDVAEMPGKPIPRSSVKFSDQVQKSKPPPEAVVAQTVNRRIDGQIAGGGTYHPLSRDPELTKRWKDEIRQLAGTAAQAGKSGGRRSSNDFAAMETCLHEILELKAPAGAPFRIHWSAMPMVDSPEKDSADEDDEQESPEPGR